MSKATFASLVGVAAAGGKLALTWEDCGDASTHGHTDDIQPSEIVIGQDTTITGTGATDKEISSGTFAMKLTASMGIKATYTGKICEAKEFKMPLGIGTVSWAGMDCPVAVGPSSVGLGVKMVSVLPAALAKADLSLTAVDQDGEQALCVNTHLVKEKSDLWEDFKAEYGKNYAGDEEATRRAIFEANMDFIDAENAKGHSYTLGMGPFADITAEEFKASRLGYNQPESDTPVLAVHQWQGEDLEDRIDWTEKNVVTAVKDQGQCGSCWAFSTTGALESGYALATGNLVSLSEQQHVDCDGFPNLGCSGGQMKNALKWSETHDLCTEESYPYTAKGGILSSCKSSGCDVAIKSGTVTGVTSLAGLIGKASDQDMMSALQQQPLSIAIEADQDIFQHYKSGVITGSCGTSTDHGVLLVGYGTDGSDYWKVKNSWGSSWGDNGFVRMVRGKNQCGINSGPNYPEFASSVSV